MAKPKPNEGSSANRRVDLWMLAVIALPIIYFFPEFLGLNVFAGIDTSRLNMPLRMFDREAFSQFALPLWNPYMFAGFPNLAESESGVFYPGSIFMHLPGDFFHWYSISVIAHFIIAGLGFYFWMVLRGHSKPVSAYLAAIYTTTPFLIFHITAFGLFTSIVWLPWYFVIYQKGLNSEKPFLWGLWFTLFLAFMLMSGSVQAAFLGILGLLLYAISNILSQPDKTSRKTTFHKSFHILFPAIIAPLIAAIQLIPTAELSALSERAATDDPEFYSLGTWLTIKNLASLVIFPYIKDASELQDYGSSLCYLGAVPLCMILAGLGLWMKEGRAKYVPLCVSGLIMLILAFGMNLPLYHYLIEFPPFSLFRYPGRAAHIAFTLFLPLAAPSIEYFLSVRKPSPKTFRGMIALLSITTLAVILVSRQGVIDLRGPLAGGATTSLLLGIVLASFTGLLIFSNSVTVTALRIFQIALILGLISQAALTYPFSRFLVQDRQSFDKSIAFFDELKSDFGKQSEIPRIIIPGGHELLDPDALSKIGFSAQSSIWDNMAGNASGLAQVTSLSGLTPLNQYNWKVITRDILQTEMDAELEASKNENRNPVAPLSCVKIFKMLGADYIIVEGDNWSIDGYSFWRSDLLAPFHDGMCAYRAVGGIMPDAKFATRIGDMQENDEAAVIRWLNQSENEFPPDALIELPGLFSKIGQLSLHTEIVERSRAINRMTFEVNVHSPGDGFLVTGENFYPGWNAYIDGNPTELHKTNYLLSGMIVPSGEHTIELRYEPNSVKVGGMLTTIGIVIWLISFLAIRFEQNRARKQADIRRD